MDIGPLGKYLKFCCFKSVSKVSLTVFRRKISRLESFQGGVGGGIVNVHPRLVTQVRDETKRIVPAPPWTLIRAYNYSGGA